MQSLDIPIADTDYKIVSRYNTFNLIYPHEHPLSQAIGIDMTIRVLSFPDQDYLAFIYKDKSPQDMVPTAGKFFDISYIRECRVAGVSRFEWNDNYGPTSLKQFLSVAKDSTKDSYVKIIRLKLPTYSLKELNHKYNDKLGK